MKNKCIAITQAGERCRYTAVIDQRCINHYYLNKKRKKREHRSIPKVSP